MNFQWHLTSESIKMWFLFLFFFLIVADLTILAALLCTFQSFQEG